MVFINPDGSEIKSFLQNIKTIAVLGLSPKENRPSFQVAQSLQNFSYTIIPVRKAVDEVLGEKAYPDLESLFQTANIKIDLLNVFKASKYVDDIVDQCITFKIPGIWLQDGIINHDAAVRAKNAGIFTVMDRCIYRDYVNLLL
ncbi:MAG: CoA-binding protein [Thiohalomonadales bacterium]